MGGYLLDTCVLLWAFLDEKKLSGRAAKIINDISNDIFISTVSVWEISIKYDIGKLQMQNTWMVDLEDFAHSESLQWLPLKNEHCFGILNLPKHHNDQFDRLLISQAKCEEMRIITSDEKFKRYKVRTLW